MPCDKLVDSFCVLGDACTCFHEQGLVYSDKDGWCRKHSEIEHEYAEQDDSLEYPQFSKFGG